MKIILILNSVLSAHIAMLLMRKRQRLMYSIALDVRNNSAIFAISLLMDWIIIKVKVSATSSLILGQTFEDGFLFFGEQGSVEDGP